MVNGSCLCGAISFAVTGPVLSTSFCHCAQCRKQSGHCFSAGNAARADVAITGEVSWYQSSDYAKRGFCGTCGSSLFWSMDSADQIAFSLGALDGKTDLRVERHIFVKDKGDYYELSDDLPKIQKF